MNERSKIKKAIEEEVEKLEKEAEDIEDLHEAFTELIADLEKEVGVMYSKMVEKEKSRKPSVSLIEHFDSEGESSLVLRADCVSKKDFPKARKALKELEKKLEKEEWGR